MTADESRLLSWGSPEAPLVPSLVRATWGDQEVPVAVSDDLGTPSKVADLDGVRRRPRGWSNPSRSWACDFLTEWLIEFPGAWTAKIRIGHVDDDLQQLPLTARARNALNRIGIHTVAGLDGRPIGDLMAIRAFGVRSLMDVLCTVEAWAARAGADDLALARRLASLADVRDRAVDLVGLAHNARTRGLHRHQDAELRAAMSADSALGRVDDLDLWIAELNVAGGAALVHAACAWDEDVELAPQTVARFVEDQASLCITDERGLRALLRHIAPERGEPETLDEIAADYGVSRERIRQLESKSRGLLVRHLSKLEVWQSVRAHILSRTASCDVGEWLRISREMWPSASIYAVRLAKAVITGVAADTESWKNDSKALAARQRETVAERRRLARTEARVARVAGVLSSLLEGADWPQTLCNYLPHHLPTPTRLHGTEEHDLIYPSDKLGRNVRCESQMEATFFEMCDATSSVESFVEQPVAIPYEFDGARRRYHPDALVVLNDRRALLVEIKPPLESTLAINVAKWDAAAEWCHRRGLGFLATDCRTNLLKPPAPRPQLVDALRDLADNPPIAWIDILKLRTTLGFTSRELSSAILQAGLVTTTRPWRLMPAIHANARLN